VANVIAMTLWRAVRPGLVAVAACASLLLASCAAAETEVTDQQAKTVADAISYPRQTSAEGLARAALATHLGKTPDFSVLEARDIDAKGPTDPMAHLVFRIHRDGSDSGWNRVDPVTACYGVDFGHDGVIGTPERIPCPDNAVPITPPPPPPTPRREVPDAFDEALRSILTSLPATASEADVLAALHGTLPAPPVDPETGLVGETPTVAAVVRADGVGVAVRAGEGSEADCLLGTRRTDGSAQAWRPSREQVRPGELSCSPDTALLLAR
jgi:hypothetical protein